MDPLAAVIGAGSSLAGGLLGSSSQQAINTANQNAAQQMAMNSITWRVNDARRAGINPLAALGSNFAPGPATAVGSEALGKGVEGMGQNIARALAAQADRESKSAQLDNEYKQAQIDLAHSEAARNLAHSRAALIAQPGTPPGIPLPPLDPRYEPEIKPSMQRWETSGGRIATPSRDFTSATFSIDPVGIMHALTAELGNITQPYFLRPDVMRQTVGTPDLSQFGGGL